MSHDGGLVDHRIDGHAIDGHAIDAERSWGACQMVCVSGVSYLKEIDYGYDQAEEARRARAGA